MIASVATKMPIVAAFVVFVVMFSSLSLLEGWRYLLDFRYLTEIISESLPDAPQFGLPHFWRGAAWSGPAHRQQPVTTASS
jgi:hypothetical protein